MGARNALLALARNGSDVSARDHFETERENPASAALDTLSVGAAFDVLNAEDARVAAAVARAKGEIVKTIELVADRLSRGGRLIYVGAGTSGRLAVLDATECPPTFQSDPTLVQGVIAGGDKALTTAVEGAEDSSEAGAEAVRARKVKDLDVVLGIAAGGTTPFVHGALAQAQERGAATVFFACVPRDQAPDGADISIRVITGPEVVAGSTRMKAGTATKLVLNAISTLVMVRLGKVHGNLMVDVNTRGNAKLWQRGIGLVARIAQVDRAEAEALLEAAGGAVKVAVVMRLKSLSRLEAEENLRRAGGVLRRALA
ncbi:MAG: N-acetylmuramic acid 6-phosphate etherase [Planctomycetes bacterium]|nr:N-acetylmuramic acid 6-phosphate etherase [Planctomycetota bacterium]